MVLQNSNNQAFSVNGDGWSLGAGITPRTLTLSGADFSLLLNSVGSGDLVQFNGTNWVNVPGSSVGTGSVTSVALAGSNGIGISGSPITNAGTITLTLGAITPTSVAATGTISASNFSGSFSGTSSGTNTGDQTITLTGAVTGSGTGSFATTIAATGVSAGTYGAGTSFPSIVVNAAGQITSATTVDLGSIASQNSNNVTITGGTITGLPTPTSASDAATKSYVDGIAAGIDAKQSVVAATTGANIALDGSVTSLDGVTLTNGERVLVKDQTDATQNGIYIVSSTAWQRSTDMATGENAEANFTFVAQGSANAGKGFVVYSNPATVGTDPISWTQFSEVGAYGATVNGGLVLGTGTPADFGISFDNLAGAGTISLSTNVLVSNDGITPVSTTVGSLANLITGGSALNAAVTSGQTASALTYSSGTFTLNVDGTSVQNSANGLSVVADGATITNTPSGIAVISAVNGGLANTPGGVTLDVSNLNSASTITSIDTLPIYDAIGGTTVSVTLGSLATYVGSNAIFGTGAITVTGGTVALVTDNEFSQTGGTLSLGNITPTNINTVGNITGSGYISVQGSVYSASSIQAAGPISASNFNGSVNGTFIGLSSGTNTGDVFAGLGLYNTSGTFNAETDNSTVIVNGNNQLQVNFDTNTMFVNGMGYLAVSLYSTGGISTFANSGLILALPNLPAGTTGLTSSDITVIDDGSGPKQTTLGSLATFFASNSVFGTGAITAVNGTVALNTDSEFTQTGGSLSLGDITPSSVTSAGSVSGSLISGTIVQNNGTQVVYAADGVTIVKTGGDNGTVALAASGVSAGTYGSQTNTSIVTVDTYGRVVSATTGTTTLGTGSVTEIDTGAYLVGGPITGSGTISHGTSGVTAGTYGLVVVDQYGHVTSGSAANIAWVDVTTGNQQLAPNVGYFTDSASPMTLTLPTSANFGDVIELVGFGPGLWTIAQNAGQTIYFGIHQTTTGTAGYLQATSSSDSLEIFCKSSSVFVIRNSVGNISIA